ncbi:DNA methyltransferase [Fimbriimonas ginsengisoli]|uniref:Methyltransferase n=1 Tax=Fimbriimonas ginsengisoli Gsoil 348 TaxID=661478 RepID=A0A068NJ83_FIMGI|nr:DNA methyltransferase [Fimbriimonas ginsengisoli]AIE83517.1 DNA methylase N-4/N-6 domain protein [Fimbriimonas ginsengisoli Gsoil 348]
MPSFNIRLTDCVTGLRQYLAPGAAKLVVTSIPFGALFMYSGKVADIGNCSDGVDMRASEFGLHMRFFVESLWPAMMPGRIACIHIQQLLRYKNQHGYAGRRDFRGAVIDLFTERDRFEWVGEVVIPKNPQVIAKRLSLHSLQFMTGRERDACKLAPAVNDYVLFFRKPGENPEPVKAIHDASTNRQGWLESEEWIRDAYGVWRWDDLVLNGQKGQRIVPGLGSKFDENFALEGFTDAYGGALIQEWQESGIWDDIMEGDVLQNWRSARASKDEKHVCPLQLEVIRRCVRLYSNPGDLVVDPFMGIGSTAVVAIEEGRDAAGFELKESYHAQANRNAKKAVEAYQPNLLRVLTGGGKRCLTVSA